MEGNPVAEFLRYISTKKDEIRTHLDGMVDKSWVFGGLPSFLMGWDQSPVDGNGMGWKLMCVVME